MLVRRESDDRPSVAVEDRSDEGGGGGAIPIDGLLLSDCERTRGFVSEMFEMRGRILALAVVAAPEPTFVVETGAGLGAVYVLMSKSSRSSDSKSSSSLSSFWQIELLRL